MRSRLMLVWVLPLLLAAPLLGCGAPTAPQAAAAPQPAASARPVWVLGEVVRPGALSWQPGLTVGEALAMAGGLADGARADRVLLRRGGANVPGERADTTRPVTAGDVLEVPARIF